ncbi:phage terminase small subunit [Pseudomonas jilinensis]|uniref:Terminase n=1 Tax=Pseudomonas jilinensis TaxID=2078689 RepID=A0A396SDU6_9PSED|nr:phage terminase small subunit [Pseudomonas jilinensis]RHW21685.1 terminase [Pseudomonas jilinensis]
MNRNLSPAARHMARVAAKQAAVIALEEQGSMANATVYEQFLAKLQQDHLRLKQIQSDQGKAELKRQLLPEYEDYIKGVLESGAGVQDDVIATLMVWAIDAERYSDLAIPMATYVLAAGLKLPDRFARTPATLIAEEIASAALERLKTGNSFDVETLISTRVITLEHDMPDQVRAKLELALGKAILKASDEVEFNVEALKLAREYLARAIELHSHCGGKKDLGKVDRLLKKHADTVG